MRITLSCYNPLMLIRPYHALDLTAVSAVYRDAVLAIAPQFYDNRQVKMWASWAANTDELAERLGRGLTLVAIVHKQLVAFGQLEPNDHLAMLYTAGRHGRKGIAAAIHKQLEAHARMQGVSHIDTEASHISRFFFEKNGYDEVEPETVVREGISFDRFKMRKQLG